MARRRITSEPIEQVPWSTFRRFFARQWEQGQHVSMVGATRSGKTTLAHQLLGMRKWVAAIGTKTRDESLDELASQRGWKRIEKWPPPALRQRVVLWPRFDRPSDVPNQREQIARALNEMFASGSWTIYADEAYYLAKTLGLDHLLRLYWQMGGSSRLSLVAGTQRPVNVPVEMWTEPAHLFIFRAADVRDLERVAQIGPAAHAQIMDAAPSLPRHEFLYHSKWDGRTLRSRVELPE